MDELEEYETFPIALYQEHKPSNSNLFLQTFVERQEMKNFTREKK